MKLIFEYPHHLCSQIYLPLGFRFMIIYLSVLSIVHFPIESQKGWLLHFMCNFLRLDFQRFSLSDLYVEYLKILIFQETLYSNFYISQTTGCFQEYYQYPLYSTTSIQHCLALLLLQFWSLNKVKPIHQKNHQLSFV